MSEEKKDFFSAEELAALDGYLAFEQKEVVAFTPKVFDAIPEDKRPVYNVQPMNGEVEAVFYGLYDNVDQTNNMAVLDCYIRAAMRGMTNHRTKSGTVVEYETDAESGLIKDSVLQTMSISLKLDIKAVILGGKD